MADKNPAIGLQRVSAEGGDFTVLSRPVPGRGELDHVWPEMLPGGRAVLFTITAITGGVDASQVAVLDLATRTHKIVMRGGSHAHYVPTGHLVYAAGGTLRAIQFDIDRLETRGASATVLNQLVTTPEGAGEFDVADDGTLVYADGPEAATLVNTLVWVDRQGREEPLAVPPRAYYQPRVSPDGTKVAVAVASSVWVWNLRRHRLNRLNFDPAFGFFPVWAKDSRRLYFSSLSPGTFGIYSQSPDVGGAAEELVTRPSGGMLASDVTRDGTRVIFSQAGRDVMALVLDGTRRVESLVQTPFNERNGIVSPDGRWLAYESDSSGRFEIYVQPFPDVKAAQWLISTDGGTRPLWMPGGQELIYVAPDGALMAVPVDARGGIWHAGTPGKVLEGPYLTGGSNSGRTYDVSKDGRRFLVVRRLADQPRPQIIVVQNWFEELTALVPGR